MIIEATYKGEPIEFFRAHKMRGNLIEADVNNNYISLYGNELISKHFHCNDADYTVEEFVKYLIKIGRRGVFRIKVIDANKFKAIKAKYDFWLEGRMKNLQRTTGYLGRVYVKSLS